MRDAALFVHLLGAFLFAAGIVVAGVAFEAARSRAAPAEIALLLGLARVGVIFVGVGTLLVLGFGLWLVQLGDWVTARVGSTPRSCCSPSPSRSAASAASRRSARGGSRHGSRRRRPATVEVAARLLDDRPSRAANYAAAVAVLAILALMVFKP